MRLLSYIFISFSLLIGVAPVRAHANLADSDPAPNARLETAPATIRLTFTEPLEANYSRITLRAIDGSTVETPPSTLDPADAHIMNLAPGALPDGIYTVVWRVLSAADGHPTSGNYAFSVGMASVSGAAESSINETIEPSNAMIRALHTLAFALPVGTVAFIVFVWSPVRPHADKRRLRALTWIGWIALGVSLIGVLVMQATIAAGAAVDLTQISAFIGGTTFGRLWLIRVCLWIAFGAAVTIASTLRGGWSAALLIGASMAVAHSAFSHAAAFDGVAIAANTLHVLGAAVWIGGLSAFALALTLREGRATAGKLVARFSKLARLAVIALVISGLYATWLHVGTLDALTTTVYGRTLLLKLILFAPLLGIAALNLLITGRALRAGKSIWVGRLRGLIVAEIALACGVLAAAGILTSGAPARGVIDARIAAAQAAIVPDPYFSMIETGDVMIHLEILPGVVGENEFIVTPMTLDGMPILDATRVRLRFDNLDTPIGRSEARAEHIGDGVYRVTGANLSLAGMWRIRLTLARPGSYDTVVDFEAQIASQP